MQLTLNGWPPLASHTVALIIGVCLAHLNSQAQPSKDFLPSLEGITLKIPTKDAPIDIKNLPPPAQDGPRTLTLHVVRQAFEFYEPCRITRAPLPYQISPKIISISLPASEIKELSRIFLQIDPGRLKAKYSGIPASAAEALPLCHFETSVIYDIP